VKNRPGIKLHRFPIDFHFQKKSIMKLIFLTTLLASFTQAADPPQVVAPAPRSLAALALAAVPLTHWMQGKYAADVGIDSLGSSMTVLAYKLVQFFDSSNAAIEGLREMIALKEIQSADHKIMELLRQPIVESGPLRTLTLMGLILSFLQKVALPNQLGDARKQFISRINGLFNGQYLGPVDDIVTMEVRAFCGIVRLIDLSRTKGAELKDVIELKYVVKLLPVLLIKDVPDTLTRLGLWIELTSCISKGIIRRHDIGALSVVMAIMHGMSSKQEDLLKVLKDSIEGLVKDPNPANGCYQAMLYEAVKPAGTFWSLRSDLQTEVVKLCPVNWRSSDVDQFYSAVTRGGSLHWEEQIHRSKDDNAAIKCILQSPGYNWLDVPYFTADGILEADKAGHVFLLTSEKVHKSTDQSKFSGIHVSSIFGFHPVPFFILLPFKLHKAINKAHQYLFGDLENSGLGLFAAYIERISVYQVVPREPFKQQIEQSFKDAVANDKS
jgi:hypothetical protein